MNELKVGDVVFSKEHNCKVNIHEVWYQSAVCDWFVKGKLHRRLLPNSDLVSK